MQRLASALVRLKGIFPTANAALLIARRPFLALHEDLTAVAAAGLELRDMLPGVDVDRRAPLSLLLCQTYGCIKRHCDCQSGPAGAAQNAAGRGC